MPEDKTEMSLLLDFYGELLTPKQQATCQDYYENDLSLQEIAEIEGISRSAVYDMINRCRTELNHYEDKLHMVASYNKRMKLYSKIQSIGSPEINQLIEKCIKTEI